MEFFNTFCVPLLVLFRLNKLSKINPIPPPLSDLDLLLELFMKCLIVSADLHFRRRSSNLLIWSPEKTSRMVADTP